MIEGHTERTPIKLCKDCKHCMRNAYCARAPIGKSVISGEMEYLCAGNVRRDEYVKMYNNNLEHGGKRPMVLCGSDASLFEPHPPTNGEVYMSKIRKFLDRVWQAFLAE